MKNLYKAIILLLAVLSLSATLSAANDDALRASVEKFVRQICKKDSQAILQAYPMTDEFRAFVPDDSVIVDWAAEIDNLFGQLGDVVNAEIVEHPAQGLRSVYLYYQGSKRPTKIWVTFRGTDIAGLHWNVWQESYEKREPTFLENLAKHPLTWWLGSLLGIVTIVVGFFYNVYRHNYDWGQNLDP